MTHPYARLSYAESLPEQDAVVHSPTLGVPLCLRSIPGTGYRDACGLYPLSPCLRPAPVDVLREELRRLGAVSLVLVSDPLGDPPSQGFDLLRPYKPHLVIDPAIGASAYSKHHRSELRRALRLCTARPVVLADCLDAFQRLYDVLIERHGLGARHRFGRAHFAHLAANPGDFPTFGAFVGERLVSAHIWVRHGDRAYSHLAASDDEGYAVGAAYAVQDCALRAFSGCLVTLGGSPDTSAGNGLERFKRGFANATRTAWLCGVIADPAVYRALSAPAQAAAAQEFFPLYRSLPAHQAPS